ncbi:MAG: GIY-YIG nuclease family protein, partial [Polaromonas sp.]
QLCDGFTARYAVHQLVWFEATESIEAAIQREKQLKNWKRDWKIVLIEKDNHLWDDLYSQIL